MKILNNWILYDGFLYNYTDKTFLEAGFLNGTKIDKSFFQSNLFKNELSKKGILKCKPSQYNQILVVELTDKCNYICSYCFEGKSIFNNRVISHDLLINRLRLLPTGSEIRFFGGEPLFQFDLIKKVVKLFPDLKYSLVTNGSLLTEDIAEFIAKKNISVGLSYDGMDWQEKTRPAYKGNSLLDFKRAIGIFNSIGHKVGISTVICKESIPDLYDIHLEVFADYKVSGWAYLLGYTPDMTLSDLDIYRAQILKIVSDFPFCHLLKINDLKKWFMKITGEWPIDSFCGAGTNFSALAVDGNERICPFFLRDEINYSPDIRKKEVKCKKCFIWDYCHGGCLALNRFGTGDTHESHAFSCKKNRIYFEAGLATAIKQKKSIQTTE